MEEYVPNSKDKLSEFFEFVVITDLNSEDLHSPLSQILSPLQSLSEPHIATLVDDLDDNVDSVLFSGLEHPNNSVDKVTPSKNFKELCLFLISNISVVSKQF